MYLGIDLGNKRCGIAVYIEGIVVPKDIVPRVEIISEIKAYIKEYSIEKIIVGLPYDLYNRDNTQLERTEKFIEKLKNIFPDKEILGIDERFTSFEAELYTSKGSRKRDDISASIILESYLGKENI